MSLLKSAFLLCIVIANHAFGQSSSQSVATLAETAIPSNLLVPSGPYKSNYDFGTTTISDASTMASNATTSVASSTTASFLGLTGNPGSSTVRNATTSTSTSASVQATNSQACNGHVEFCERKLSNISMVVAHNSPFAVSHNAASNQVLKVVTQLNDGIRGLQFETHSPNGTLRLCHTSCSLLDAGTLEAYLTTVVGWLQDNPYEVIAIMMGNDDRVAPSNYTEPFQNAGMLPYLYTPSSSSLTLSQWPTLAEMIIQNKRVVVMLDYLANQTEVPWLLDEFSYQWETPFSPTDPSFPCTEQRPPNQDDSVSRDKMFMMNHNLNIAIDFSGTDILIPAYTLLNQINAVSGNASLGGSVENCTAMWGRPPNWLLVDYYNFGNFNGSVFQVAATANNVSYDTASCCGSASTSGADHRFKTLQWFVLVGPAMIAFLL